MATASFPPMPGGAPPPREARYLVRDMGFAPGGGYPQCKLERMFGAMAFVNALESCTSWHCLPCPSAPLPIVAAGTTLRIAFPPMELFKFHLSYPPAVALLWLTRPRLSCSFPVCSGEYTVRRRCVT